MKYKVEVGDLVRIKTLKEMKELSISYVSMKHDNGIFHPDFTIYMKEEFEKIFPDRIVKIISIDKIPLEEDSLGPETIFYNIENSKWKFGKNTIKELIIEPITSRFEIIDIR